MRDAYKRKQVECTCKQCGDAFMGNSRGAYCSDVCRRKAKRNQKAKRRAVKLGVYYEPVNPVKVFERDGWRCQLCRKKLSPKHKGTMRDDAPELDHIIPWAQGGEHSYRNTQLLCRKCNGEKGAQAIGQLRLFG
jgi:5-methylcytosine-specific restriction endonuclease McrA